MSATPPRAAPPEAWRLMGINRYAHKRDANEPELIRACVDVGAKVIQLSGDGVPDLAIYFRSVWKLVEVKLPKGRLTEAQDWDETVSPGAVPVVRTVDEILEVIGAI